MTPSNGVPLSGSALTEAISAAVVALYAEFYDHERTTATTYINDNVVVCHDPGRAEDVVQESFLSIWNGRARFSQEKGSFKAWSTRIVRHRAIDARRAAAARPPLQATETRAEVPDAGSSSVQDQVVARSENDALLASLDNLPPAQAEVIALAFFGELSHSEVAAELDLPSGTVKGRMRLGLEKLRKQMGALA